MNYGYNAEKINELGTSISDIATKAGEQINQLINDRIMNKMADIWYAPEAVEYFQAFSEAANKTVNEGIPEGVNLILDEIEKAGKNWAENTGNSEGDINIPDMSAMSVSVSVDASGIADKNQNGDVVNDVEAAKVVAADLPAVRSEIGEILKTLANELETESAFIGGEQAQAVRDFYSSMMGKLELLFSYLTEDNGEESQSLLTAINTAAKKYEEVAQDIASSYSGATN